MNENLILVDLYDREIGVTDKMAAHRRPLLHRAFSIFLYDDTEERTRLLIQKRAYHKYHSGGLWANTCCSHPRAGEDLLEAATRRLYEEMQVASPFLLEINSFIYYHQFGPELFEYEFDHVLVGRYSGSYLPNPAEVAEAMWVTEDFLSKDLLDNPAAYAPWFRSAAPMVLRWLQTQRQAIRTPT